MHHIVPKQRIKAQVDLVDLPRAIADPRNLVPLCDRHHHRITHGFDRDAMREIIESKADELRDWAAAYSLTPALEHELRLYEIAP